MHCQHPSPILHTPELLPVAGPGTWRGHNITTNTNITPPRSLPTRNHRTLKRAHNEPIGPYKPCIHNTPRPSSNLGNNNTKQTPAQPPKRAKKPRNSRTRDKKLKHNFARFCRCFGRHSYWASKNPAAPSVFLLSVPLWPACSCFPLWDHLNRYRNRLSKGPTELPRFPHLCFCRIHGITELRRSLRHPLFQRTLRHSSVASCQPNFGVG